MKNILSIIISMITITIMAQKDTIYFNKHWEKVSKDKAKYYRLVPLEKVGDLYRVNDFFSNGNLQMEGFWSDIKNETLEGNTSWYFENGTLAETAQYKNGKRQGLTKTFLKNGLLKTTGVYNNDEPFDGTFPEYCSNCDVTLYKNGKELATYRYYKNTNIIAQKSTKPDANKKYEMFFYDRNAVEIAHVTMEFYQKPIDGKIIYFNTDNDRQITTISSYANYIDGILQGEAVNYNNEGKILAKGIYKDDKPFNGTFTNPWDNAIKTYKNGILDGEVLFYSDKGTLVARGINKNGKRWSGQFYDIDYDTFKTIVNYENGEMLGKQISYYTTDFEIIAETSHIKNGKKEGEVISYNKKGKVLAKGIYKDGKQWSGSFYNFYYHQLSSLKNGIKHGKQISYSTEGKILLEQEYEDGKLAGKIKTTGYFNNKECDCIYKKGEPYKGEVCEDLFIRTYTKGVLTKVIEYNDEDLTSIKNIMKYKDGEPFKETHFVKEKKYELIYKNGKNYNGVQYNRHNDGFYTFKKGLLEGPFLMPLDIYSNLWVSGNYKNNKYHGIIKFENKNTNKTATCTYENGKPIDGKVLTELGEQNYKKGLRTGKEVDFESVYLYKKGERKLIYDFVEKEYKDGKIEGKVSYFIGDSLVNTNSYKKGKPYNGNFYEDEKFIINYKKGALQTITYNPNPYTVIEYYKKNIITKVQVTKENEKPYIGYYQSGKRFSGVFFNFDNKRFPITYIKKPYKNGVKNGIEKQFEIADDLNETLINTKTYKDGKLTDQTWPNYYINTSQNIKGSYKNETPHNGYFIENYESSLYHYKDGVKEGQQYSGYIKKNYFVKTDSITYKKGKPFQGNMISSKYNLKILKQYENGEPIKAEILNNYGDITKAVVTYSDTGIVTKNAEGKILSELIYLDKTKEKAKVILYKDFKKVGTLAYHKDKITNLDITLKEAGLDWKYYLDKENKVCIKVNAENYNLIIYPKFEAGKKFDFIDFLDAENLFVNNEYDGKVNFYLDKMENPICSCDLIKGKPFNGIILRYDESEKMFRYKEYKDGERIKKVRDLSKKQLIEALQSK